MEKLPKSLRSIFSKPQCASNSSEESLATATTPPSNSSFLPVRSIGGFIKSHKKKNSNSQVVHSNSDKESDNDKSSLLSDDNQKVSTSTSEQSSKSIVTKYDKPNLDEESPSKPDDTTSSQQPQSHASRKLENSEETSSQNNHDISKPSDVESSSVDEGFKTDDDNNVVSLTNSPEDINDVDMDSDDHEEDEDPPSTLTKVHSHMRPEDAQSIIGGIPISDKTAPEDQENERQKKSSYQKELDDKHKSKSLKLVSTQGASEPKTFSFSLPFSNPLAGIELPSIKFPSFFSDSNNSKPVIDKGVYLDVQKEIGERLNRQLSVTSWQEEIAYNTVKEQDNSRLRAVKRALTPSIMNGSPSHELKEVETIISEYEGDVVVLGGYRGSILRDRATGRRVWIPIKAGFNLRKIDLTVGIDDEDEYNMEQKIYPDGMLTHIGPVDISRKLIKKLRSNPKCNVYEFGYDWRLSCDISSAKLVEFLKKLPSNKDPKSGRKGAIVIAHSMGGLVAHHAMQTDPLLFRGLIYAGVPSACPNILGPLKMGDSILLSSKILTAQVNFLMRSSYVFLPLDGRCFVNKYDHSIKYDLDLFDVNTWIEHELSPLVAKRKPKNSKSNSSETSIFKEMSAITNNVSFKKLTSLGGEESMSKDMHLSDPKSSPSFSYPKQLKIPHDQAVQYLDRTLKRTHKFLMELQFDPAKKDLYPPLGCLYSYSIPTLKGALVDNKDAIKDDSYQNLLFGPGDGVIYYKSLMPEPKGFEVVSKVSTDRGHVSLLNDVDAVLKIMSEILKEENRRSSQSLQNKS